MITCPTCGKWSETYEKPTGEICCKNCRFILNKKEIDEKYKHLHILQEMSEELFLEADEGRSDGGIIHKCGTRG